MKIDFEARTLRSGEYYITEREAEILCKQSDPNGHHVPLLPKFGWDRKVLYEGSWYWLGLHPASNKLIWTIKELD
jgi:hypothetical protein